MRLRWSTTGRLSRTFLKKKKAPPYKRWGFLFSESQRDVRTSWFVFIWWGAGLRLFTALL